MSIILSDQARTDLRQLNAFWHKYRPAAKPLSQLLKQAVAELSIAPFSAQIYASKNEWDYRRIRLPTTPYYAYYRACPEGIVIITVWSAQRGGEPRLR